MKSYFVEKLGDQYEILSGHQTLQIIEKILESSNTPLTIEQQYNLRQAFGDAGMCGNLDMPFIAYKWKEKENKTDWKWRLTVPFFSIWWLIFVLIVLPFKWLFTGNLNFKQTSKLINFNTHWYNKVVGRKWSE